MFYLIGLFCTEWYTIEIQSDLQLKYREIYNLNTEWYTTKIQSEIQPSIEDHFVRFWSD